MDDHDEMPPRECWVSLLDVHGNQLGDAVPIVVRCDPGTFTATVDKVTFHNVRSPGAVAAIAVTDMDGNRTVKAIGVSDG